MMVKFYAGKNRDFCHTSQKKPPKSLSMALMMPLFWHAESAELYETRSDAKFASGRFSVFCDFCVRNNSSGRL